MVSLSVAINGGLLFYHSHRYFSNLRSATTIFKRGLQRSNNLGLVTSRTKGHAFRLLANSNVSPGKDGSNKEIIMVDPLEAKRLAAKQMQEIQAREKLKRKRRIEAVNGAWAMIGLTAGLVIEGQTGNGILAQLAGYLSAIIHFFFH